MEELIRNKIEYQMSPYLVFVSKWLQISIINLVALTLNLLKWRIWWAPNNASKCRWDL